jgi:hypothetical protein
MSSSIEHEGWFFLPENRENQVKGKVLVNRDGNISLKLAEDFSIKIQEQHEPNSSSSFIIYGPDSLSDDLTINGLLYNNKEVTLLRCFIYSRNFSSTPEIIYHVNDLIIGKCFDNFENVKFDEYTFRCTNLESWFNINDTIKYSLDGQNMNIQTTSFDPITVNITEEFQLSIAIINRPRTKYWGYVKIKSAIFIKFIFTKPINLTNFYSYQLKFINFLSLATDEIQQVYNDGAKLNNEPVQIIWAKHKKGNKKTKHFSSMLFPFSYIKDGWENKIKNWYQAYEKYGEIFNLYFHACMNNNIFNHYQFLFLTQILESYDRKNNPPSKEHFSNRILRLINNCTINKLIFDDNGSDLFVQKVNDTRNFYTHYDDSDKPHKISSIDELYDTSRKLDKLVKYYMYKEIGFSELQIETMITRYY